MRIKTILSICCVIVIGLCASNAWAKLTSAEIARLDNDLTPMGAERAGNAEGTIPAWEGGITTPPAGYKPGMHRLDPFADDKVLFSITASNMDQYADKLSKGHQALLRDMDTFKINVYPTRRSVSFPQRIYDATRKVAETAELVEGGNGVIGAVIGIPFPIPKTGLEAIWNHLLRYRGDSIVRTHRAAPVTRGGSYELSKTLAKTTFLYHREGATEEKLNNLVLGYVTRSLAPARRAGKATLVHETLNQAKQPRRAWQYNPGQRRVLRAPEIAFDNPGGGSDGLRVTDQVDLYSGSPERYDWQLVGKRELYVPYNAYKLQDGSVKYKDIIQKKHLNPDLLRYELHRVWVVEATVKSGISHLYKRRTFYIDEDSWQIVLVDIYDNRDQLWRFQEGHLVNFYDVPAVWVSAETVYDFQIGRYHVKELQSEDKPIDFTQTLNAKAFTPAALRRSGTR
ncbi:MAG: DUF1329 domain-containing protein [Deltaproteobacteria bacterium]|nr:DUF1329 domain-containing protein [Deltaproteobacteria bacterium]